MYLSRPYIYRLWFFLVFSWKYLEILGNVFFNIFITEVSSSSQWAILFCKSHGKPTVSVAPGPGPKSARQSSTSLHATGRELCISAGMSAFDSYQHHQQILF